MILNLYQSSNIPLSLFVSTNMACNLGHTGGTMVIPPAEDPNKSDMENMIELRRLAVLDPVSAISIYM